MESVIPTKSEAERCLAKKDATVARKEKMGWKT